MASAIHEIIARLKSDGLTPEELKMVKTRSRASLLRGLANNQGLASSLATNQLRYGDWREMFRHLDRIDAVTNDDVKRVANEIFVDTNRTVGILENQGASKTSNRGGK
jgi:predicted Zn-dependent peptidase